MNRVTFRSRDGLLTGFTLSGHCTADGKDETGRLVCSAVSSAAYMACNTITEVIGANAEIQVEESYLRLELADSFAQTQTILEGFRLHMAGLAQQYEKYIEVHSEV